MIIEYIYIFKYFLFCLFVSLFLFLLSIFIVFQNPDSEKLSSYECGFNPFNDARNKFEVRFYLIGILFIVFDFEIIYSYPWIISIHSFYVLSHVIFLIFLFLLSIGFIYEWMKGALDWE